MQGVVVGREVELGAIAQLLDGVAEGPTVLAFVGEAGIGKTTLWAAGVERARELDFTVLACRPAAAEVRLSYAGLADLLADVGPEGFDDLPSPQARALDAALLRGADDDAVPDPRAVSAGFLSVLDGLARSGPVMVAIDDIQWLDEPTRRVVEFAVRRCSGPIATLTARRVEEHGNAPGELRARDPKRHDPRRIGPLSLGALHHVLKQHTGHAFSRHELVRIAEASGGNPFFALELARSFDARSPRMVALPDSLRSLVWDRIEALAPSLQQALLVASALATPRVELVERALGRADAADSLGAAEDAGVIELSGGMVRFAHPLLAGAVYGEASPTARRSVHRRLSGLVNDIEERARHLALAAIGPDAETVAALDAAAAQARRRGAPSAAAELLELAMGLGADKPTRRMQAAQDHFHAGDPATAQASLETAIANLDPGPSRAKALYLLGVIRFQVDAHREAIELLERASAEASGHTDLRASIGTELAYVLVTSGRVADSLPYAIRAVEDAEQLDDDGLLAEALGGKAIAQVLLGERADEADLARALALEDPDRRTPAVVWPSLTIGLVYLWSHRLDEALAALATVRQRCLDHGAESDLWFVSLHVTYAFYLAGDTETASRLVDEMVERAGMVGTEHARAVVRTEEAQLWAWIGRVDAARLAASEAVALAATGSMAVLPMWARGVAGMLELSVGDHEAAAGWLVPAADAFRAIGSGEPATTPLLPDAAEALVTLGRLDEAEPLIELLEASGRRPDRHWAHAVGARCRALWLAATGQPEAAEVAFEKALAAHDRLPQLRYDRARTLLLQGKLQRRSNQRRAAHASLSEAAGLFAEVGTAQWARNAREELDRLGLRPGPSDELTTTEQHVAELAASGLTNREVAAALFISPKTVEAHLGRVYRKRGIRSRAELGRHMAQTERQPDPSPT